MLFRLKWFLFYSVQFLQNALSVITPQSWCLIHWRLLWSGFRSVFVNATDKSFGLKLDLYIGIWFRATEWLVRALVRSLPGWTSSTQKISPATLTLKFEIWAVTDPPKRFSSPSFDGTSLRITDYQLLQPMQQHWNNLLFLYIKTRFSIGFSDPRSKRSQFIN